MPEHYAAGFLRPELSGAEQRRHCVSVTRIKRKKTAAINEALGQCSAAHPVFYEDEVDIHLNPKIGADWQLRGQQKRVVTPRQNEKYYLAGALHSGTGKVSYVGGNSKSSVLFIEL